jgi:hypothetical protein
MLTWVGLGPPHALWVPSARGKSFPCERTNLARGPLKPPGAPAAGPRREGAAGGKRTLAHPAERGARSSREQVDGAGASLQGEPRLAWPRRGAKGEGALWPREPAAHHGML